MCLYPRIIKNKRYSGYVVKKGDIKCEDERQLYVTIGCGKCIECRKQKSREWLIRLNEELKVQKHPYYVTLTFTNESLINLCEDLKTKDVNEIATKSVRRFLERYRKKYEISLRHWLITELGHENTERIHLHGILFYNDAIDEKELAKLWKYGQVDIGEYCNSKTISYIVKYVTKIDTDHKGYEPIILCSAGIGRNYFLNEANKRKHRYQGKDTIQYYTLNNGQRVALPIYYRNHLWTMRERQKLWSYQLDQERTYVRGIRIDKINDTIGYRNYMNILKCQQADNLQMGYGSTEKQWNKKQYNVDFKMLNRAKKV